MINLTLVVQAGNFAIAYVMIRTLLLRPAIVCIDEDDAAYERVLAKIANQKEKLKKQQEHVEKRWREFQQTFLEREPAVEKAHEISLAIIPGLPAIPAVDETFLNQLVQKTTDELIEEVAHVG